MQFGLFVILSIEGIKTAAAAMLAVCVDELGFLLLRGYHFLHDLVPLPIFLKQVFDDEI